MNYPKVSIIIPVYNGMDYLNDAIDSALGQTYKNLEIIVVNDGSCDNGETEKIALSYGEKIRYFSKVNGGVASALNLAIANMEGEYFSWLSHDDYYEKNKIESEIIALSQCGDEMAVVFGNYMIEDIDRKSKTVINLEKIYDKEKLEYSVYPILVGAVSGCTVLFNVKHFEKIGIFDERLITVQDYDFWFKLFKDQKNIFMEDMLMTVRWHKNQGSKTLHEYTKERDVLYTGFLNSLSLQEKETLFGSVNAYFCIMLRKLLEWGLKTAFWRCVDDITSGARSEYELKSDSLVVGKGAKSIYIFGAGQMGRSYAVILKMLGVNLTGFIDNDETKDGKMYVGLECRRLKRVTEKDALIIVAMKGNIECVFKQLIENGFNNMISWEHLEPLLQENIISTDKILEYIINNKIEIEKILDV